MIPTTRPPILFRLAKFMLANNVRGGQRLLDAVARLGILNRNVICRLPTGTKINVPMHLGRAYYWFDERFIADYEAETIRCLSREAQSLPTPITFVDCGADFGLVCAKLAAEVPHVSRLIAFEPNPAVQEVLAANIQNTGIPAQVYSCAVSDFAGRGSLVSPLYDPSVHARFLRSDANGSLIVQRVDDVSFPIGGALILKIDVEGGEMGVVKGSLGTLRRSGAFVVSFEAHQAVFNRTRIDPVEVILEIERVRKCRAYISESKDFVIDPGRPFFEQAHGRRICNIICRSI